MLEPLALVRWIGVVKMGISNGSEPNGLSTG
jgi:hypothetical protein